jgi:hypothetical protein
MRWSHSVLEWTHFRVCMCVCQTVGYQCNYHVPATQASYFTYDVVIKHQRDFRLPPRCRWDLRSSGILRSVEWQFCTEVSGQPIGPIFTGQDFQKESLSCWISWPLKMGPIGCPETSVQNYQSTLRNIPEERRSQIVTSKYETLREPLKEFSWSLTLASSTICWSIPFLIN